MKWKLFPSEACCSLNEDTVDFFDEQCVLSASQHHVWVFPLLSERQQKLRTQIVYNGLPKFFGKIIICLSTPTVGSRRTQWVVMAARHCRSWRRWWFCRLVNDSHEVMTALIVMYPVIVVVEISLQLHRSLFLLFLEAFGVWMYGCPVESEQFLCSIDVGQFSLHRIEGKKHVCALSLSLGTIVLHSLMHSTLCLQALSSWLNLQFTEDYPNEGRDGRRVSSPLNNSWVGKSQQRIKVLVQGESATSSSQRVGKAISKLMHQEDATRDLISHSPGRHDSLLPGVRSP